MKLIKLHITVSEPSASRVADAMAKYDCSQSVAVDMLLSGRRASQHLANALQRDRPKKGRRW